MSDKKIVNKELEIRGELSREEIVEKVVSKFLEEQPGKGWDNEYHYYVETLSDDRKIYLKRPTWKKNFDFKIEAEKDGEKWDFGGEFDDYKEDFREKAKENPEDFELLYQAIKKVHACNDVDEVVESIKDLEFDTGFEVEFLLKVLKWHFILEDIYAWNYDGRDKFMNWIVDFYHQETLD